MLIFHLQFFIWMYLTKQTFMKHINVFNNFSSFWRYFLILYYILVEALCSNLSLTFVIQLARTLNHLVYLEWVPFPCTNNGTKSHIWISRQLYMLMSGIFREWMKSLHKFIFENFGGALRHDFYISRLNLNTPLFKDSTSVKIKCLECTSPAHI